MIRVGAERSRLQQCVHLYITRSYHDGSAMVLEWDGNEVPSRQPVSAGAVTDPSIRLEEEQAQKLFDDLWSAGFRPHFHEPESYRRDHLEDLQNILQQVLPSALRTPAEEAVFYAPRGTLSDG